MAILRSTATPEWVRALAPDLPAELTLSISVSLFSLFASVVGRENVQAGTDCGIGSRVGHPEIAWAKLAAMAEGAALASKRLWK